MKDFNKSIWLGILIGIVVPIVGSALVLMIFEQLAKMDLIRGYGETLTTTQQRTVYVLGIMVNLIPFQYFKFKKEERVMTGIVMMTILAVLIWVGYYYKTLL